jgi:phosphoglucosamine mutase
MGKLFGTDGVRGIANVELTAEMAHRLGRTGAYVLTSELKHNPRILVGTDTRISADMLSSALISGICSVGAEAIDVGILPTPAIAYLIKHYNADSGVVITASHNPFEQNGIKFFNGNGYKLSDEIENRIEGIILQGSEEIPRPIGKNLGRKRIERNAIKDYLNHIKSTAPCNFKQMRIAMDCANGACFEAAPELFEELGAEVFVVNGKPDGTNINDRCGATDLTHIRSFVKDVKADIGLAFDGDADRLIAVDENGDIVDGDLILAIIALEFKKNGTLKNNTVVSTVMCNLAFEQFMNSNGISVVKTKVGDRYVLSSMLKNGFTLGGEQSGHVIMLEYNSTGDGLATAVQLLSILRKSRGKMSELSSIFTPYPQVIKNAIVDNENKHKYLGDEEIISACTEIENDLKHNGRLLVRPSGTEPLVRVMIEGQDIDFITKKADHLVNLIEQRLKEI